MIDASEALPRRDDWRRDKGYNNSSGGNVRRANSGTPRKRRTNPSLHADHADYVRRMAIVRRKEEGEI